MTAQPEEDRQSYYAKTALSLMQQHDISPDPENYAIWFQYTASRNRELVHEIDNAIKNSLKFTPKICSYLHSKYILGDNNQKIINDASQAAQKVLLEVLRVINDFSGETQNYNKDVDHYLENITQEFKDENVTSIFKQLISATSQLRQSGEKIHKKLEESKEEITHLKENLQQITIEAQRDFLTGLINRKTFEQLAEECMRDAREKESNLCLIMIDIDHFKQFNDKFGHLLGDEVLKIVARTLSEMLKGRDIVARFGGEEFVAVLPETPIEGAMKVAEVIRGTIANKELKRKDTGTTYGAMTVSMGVASFRATDSLASLVKRADDALYQSKHAGRNRVTRGAG